MGTSVEPALQLCLPPHLRGSGTVITKLSVGWSGAGVYRVESDGRAYVLKLAGQDGFAETWPLRLEILRRAAEAGVAPAIAHVDEGRRAIVTEFVVDRGFPHFFHATDTRERAMALVGATLRRVHEIPLPAEAPARDPRQVLAGVAAALAGFTVPPFVTDLIERALAAEAPAADRAPALSHNDVNPTNLAFDGSRLVLLDWDAAGVNDPLFDLATASLFLRMDEPASRHLIAAHDAAEVAALPERFRYWRRLVAATIGGGFLSVARATGHEGSAHPASIGDVMTLSDCVERRKAAQLSLDQPEGQWAFGLALLKEGNVL